ncbi:transposase (plasmid) [Listeria monocytogenes]|uniref:transposase n=1 Tax=Listeria monocytogenes TaxID=1639 RepID=UPI001284ED6C|nr:transposase [Listeria monocytogenes]ECJ9723956.1 transposase [Listeria monocytogenes]ECP9685347.1 transposase [Listeria monocytogenes]QWU95861.1 transposase [Listeria monocytogenes]
MNFKVDDKVTWIKDKNVTGKIVNISDFRVPTMKYAVDFGFNDLVFCGQEDIILENPVEELKIDQSKIDRGVWSKYKNADGEVFYIEIKRTMNDEWLTINGFDDLEDAQCCLEEIQEDYPAVRITVDEK